MAVANKTRRRTRKPKTWDEMTPAERRVAIAKDVIEQIQLGAMRISKGVYLRGKVRLSIALKDEPLSCEEARYVQSKCSMCARGAMMISRVAKFDQAGALDIGIDYSCEVNASSCNTTNLLEGAFNEFDLWLIECVFEETFNEFDSDEYAAAAIFSKDHPRPADRLLAICQNIVDHGEFRPEVRYDVVKV